jgi:hypothetical protein
MAPKLTTTAFICCICCCDHCILPVILTR